MDRDPTHIMQVGMGFWPSKTLLSAVELELFTQLGSDSMTGEELRDRLGLHARGDPRLPGRAGRARAPRARRRGRRGPLSQHARRPRSSSTRTSPAYIGGILEMSNARLYGFWGDLTEALRTGKPQNEVKHNGQPMFEELYSDPGAAGAVHAGDGRHLARQLRGARARSSTSRGTRRSATSAARPASSRSILAARHPHLQLHELRPAGRRADRARGRSPRRGSPTA